MRFVGIDSTPIPDSENCKRQHEGSQELPQAGGEERQNTSFRWFLFKLRKTYSEPDILTENAYREGVRREGLEAHRAHFEQCKDG